MSQTLNEFHHEVSPPNNPEILHAERVLKLKQWAEKRLSPTIDLPEELLSALIPQVLLEKAKTPENVAVIRVGKPEHFGSQLEFLIKERMAEPISDVEEWENYILQLRQRKLSFDRAGTLALTRYAPRPVHIDPFHITYIKEIVEGKLSLNDKICLEVRLEDTPNKAHNSLRVSFYEDIPELRGKGITFDFYKNLREIAKILGYRFIHGNNNSKNLSYFTDKLGRTLLKDIRSDKRLEITGVSESWLEDVYTVDFLFPEDKPEYISKRKRN